MALSLVVGHCAGIGLFIPISLVLSASIGLATSSGRCVVVGL